MEKNHQITHRSFNKKNQITKLSYQHNIGIRCVLGTFSIAVR